MEKDRRITGRHLQAIRRRHFTEHPLCVRCLTRGQVRAAIELDHIVPLFKGGKDEPANRQGLCLECHREKTAEDLGLRQKGCDLNGLPTDPTHPWNK